MGFIRRDALTELSRRDGVSYRVQATDKESVQRKW